MQPLTAGQTRVLAAAVEYAEANGHFPTVRALCRALGFRSSAGVSRYLRALEKKGYLDRDGRGWCTSQIAGSDRPVVEHRGDTVVLVVPGLARVTLTKDDAR